MTDIREPGFQRWQKVVAEMEVCLCGACKACPYRLFSRASREASLCFSCRMGLHAGDRLVRDP